jgi:hypothetical protein
MFADVVYALWSLLAVAAFALWAASRLAGRNGVPSVQRPSVLVAEAVRHPAARLVVVLAWGWVGFHLFAR